MAHPSGGYSPTSTSSEHGTLEDTVIQRSSAEELARITKKADAIRRACDLRDLDALISHASSNGGFLCDELRRLAWPILLQYDDHGDADVLRPEHSMPPHGDEEQVKLDVNRSFVYYPDCSDKELLLKKDELLRVIKRVLRNYPMLCYFQGYHDIVQVLLLVLGENDSAPAVAKLSLLRIRDYMLPSLSPSLKHLQLIPTIIKMADKALSRHISGAEPFFALSATLTLYAHDIQGYRDVARLFDFLLAWEPVVSIYFFAAVVLSRRKELFEISSDEPEILHSTLSKLPTPLDLESLISQTVRLFHDYPPESLPTGIWRKIPRYSVLKTSRDVFKKHSTKTALELFYQQTQQLRREERKEQFIKLLWNHRRTIGSIAVAAFIGAISIWIRKRGLDNSIFSYMDQFRTAFGGRL
ncbi:rab-GTPase-TBC domain-containing protein [Aspergillus lucknowensis]|uniref:Rab-GTPase-TBC domain-containing protein n=1 Tax=Aspergillus lucknowensis TaxID=176173 RepID=A0ABR4M3A7_9EURO